MDLHEFMPEPVSIIGVDLGQRLDFTALCVIERHLVPDGEIYAGERLEGSASDGYELSDCGVIPVRIEYHCRHLERYREVPYPDVVEDILDLVDAVAGDRVLVVDATGVGLPIFDNLYRALVADLRDRDDERKIQLVGVLIHGGDKVTSGKPGVRNVPKRDLVGVSQVVLESGRLKIAEGLDLKDVLLDELRNFRVKISPETAHDSYSHFREGEHDDLVLSVALGLWIGEARMAKRDKVEVPGYIITGA